jgi:hypothetical protein
LVSETAESVKNGHKVKAIISRQQLETCIQTAAELRGPPNGWRRAGGINSCAATGNGAKKFAASGSAV